MLHAPKLQYPIEAFHDNNHALKYFLEFNNYGAGVEILWNCVSVDS
jgi:hypothetical protein